MRKMLAREMGKGEAYILDTPSMHYLNHGLTKLHMRCVKQSLSFIGTLEFILRSSANLQVSLAWNLWGIYIEYDVVTVLYMTDFVESPKFHAKVKLNNLFSEFLSPLVCRTSEMKD